jgi:DNA invertase Pin-like site-specific DNA recombinase
MKTYLWARVSSVGQNLTYQTNQLKEAYPDGILISSKHSGASKKNEQELFALIEKCEPGDKIVATRMSRCARSMSQLCRFFEACDKKEIDVHLLNEEIDSSNANGRLQRNLLMCLCSWQREIIRENTDRGRADALKRGVRFGKKSKISKQRRHRIIKAKEEGKTLREIAEAEDLSVSYVHRLCNPDKNKVYKENHQNWQHEKRKTAAAETSGKK